MEGMMGDCKKCLRLTGEWFCSIVKKGSLVYEKSISKKELKINFDSIFGKGEFDKAYVNGKIYGNWEGICKFCKTKYHISNWGGICLKL